MKKKKHVIRYIEETEETDKVENVENMFKILKTLEEKLVEKEMILKDRLTKSY